MDTFSQFKIIRTRVTGSCTYLSRKNPPVQLECNLKKHRDTISCLEHKSFVTNLVYRMKLRGKVIISENPIEV